MKNISRKLRPSADASWHPRDVFYGWWLVGISAVMLTLMSVSVFQGIGTFLVALERQFGWGRTTLSGAFALARVQGAVIGPIEGYLIDRVGIKRMILPGLIAVLSPVAVGLFDKEALAGMLVGVTVSGVLMAIFQSNAGGAWDNAKKHIEAGAFGGKGSEPHKASVVGDTVGDPFKDTSGPALNILIKLTSIVAVVLAPLIA